MYASQRIEKLRSGDHLTTHCRFSSWQPVTLEGFFGVIINMGLIQVANLESYWSTNWISEIPFFSHVFSRNRFEQIFWLHVSHEEPGQPARQIDKVKSVLDFLVANFQASYTPSRNLAVDETMVGFRGRFSPKQYMPKKPTKNGIKAFTLAESEQGYILDILVYTGSDTLAHADSRYDSPTACSCRHGCHCQIS